jgi:hypothetical protein
LCFTELRYAEILGITLGENKVIVHVWREREREREKGVTARKKRMAVFRTTHLAEPRLLEVSKIRLLVRKHTVLYLFIAIDYRYRQSILDVSYDLRNLLRK